MIRERTSFTLPLFQANISLKPFLWLSPWVIVGLHFYLLIHLRLALAKVRRFESTLKNIFGDGHRELQQYLHNTPLVQFILGSFRQDRLTHAFLRVISLFTLVFPPGITVLLMEIWFLSFHETWTLISQFLAQIVDFCLVVFLWPRIVQSKYDPAP